MNLEIPSIRLRHRSWPVITFIGTQWSPRRNKGQKMNKNVKFWHSLKVKPGLINLKTGATQWRVGAGRQRGTKVREAGERIREAGDSDPPVSPHHLHKITTIYKAPESFGHLNFPRIPVAPVKFVDRLLLLNVYQQSILQTEGYCRPLEPQCDFFGTLILWLKHLSSIWL